MPTVIAALVAALVAGAATPPPAAPPSPRVKPLRLLVFDFAVQGEAAKDLGRTLAEAAAHQINATGGFQVLTQAEAVTQLGVEHLRQMTGCAADRSCMAEIAGALDADRTMGGTVTQIGDGFHVSVSLVDARKAVTLGGARETLRNARTEELLDAARRLAHEAVTGKPLETSGTIDFEVTEPGARVLLDGAEIGQGPLRLSRRASEGAHQVLVAKEGFATWQSGLRITPGLTSLVKPALVELPRGAGGPRVNGPLYLEVQVGGTSGASFTSTGQLPPCDTISKGWFCVGQKWTGRVGWRFSPMWSSEAAFHFLGFQRNLKSSNSNMPRMDLAARGGTVAVAWTPWERGGFSVGGALEVGAVQTTSALPGARAVRVSPLAIGEGRLDKAWSWFQVGLRAGLTVLPIPAEASMVQGSTTYAIPKQTALLGTFGLALRAWF